MAGKIQHENKFRAYLAGKKRPNGERLIADDSVDSYVIYLEAVSHGIDDALITPKLLRDRDDDDIVEEARKKPLRRGKWGAMPAERYIPKWKRALKHYREMCEEKGL